MLKQIKKFLQFDEKIYSWNDMDTSIRINFLKSMVICIAVFIFAIVLLFVDIKMYSTSIILLTGTLIYFLYSYYILNFFFYGKFVIVKGTIIKVNKKEKNISFKGRSIYSSVSDCHILLKDERDNIYKIPISYYSTYQYGNTLALYFNPKDIMTFEKNNYDCNKPLAVTVISRDTNDKSE